MNLHNSVISLQLAILLIVATASAQAQTQPSEYQDKWQDWSSSILAMTEQVSLLAIDVSSEQIHRFEVRRKAFSVDTANEQKLVEGLQQTLQQADMSERERVRTQGDIEAEQQAVQMRRNRAALVQEQIAQFAEVKSALADTASAAETARLALEHTDPIHPVTQQSVMNVYLKITATLRHMQLVEMETQLALVEAEEAEFQSKTRAQARAVDVYREALERSDISQRERDFDETSLAIYVKREARYRTLLNQFREDRQGLEKNIKARQQQLALSGTVESQVDVSDETNEETQRLTLLLLEMRAEILEERVLVLEDQRHSISIAKAGLQQVLDERREINQRGVHGPEGIIFRGEKMHPSAPARAEELNCQNQKLNESIRLAIAQATGARTEANEFEVQSRN